MKKMKKIISIMMFAILIIYSIAFAEETASANKDTTTFEDSEFEDSAIAAEAVPQEKVNSEISKDVQENALTRLNDGIKYAFTFNKEKKTELSLEIAKRKLLLFTKQMQKNNTQAAQNAQEQYSSWMQKAENMIETLPAETKIETAAKIHNSLDLNEKIADKLKLTAQKADTQQAKEMIAQKINLIEKRMEKMENLTSEEIDLKKINARLANSTMGSQESAEAFIRIAKKDIEKAKSIVETMTEKSANATQIQKAEEMILNAEAELELAQDSKEQGKYAAAKEHALKARKIVMDAYIRSRFNALSKELRENITAQDRTENKEQMMQERLNERIQDKSEAKLCAQVITPAINQQGNCVEYSTPCDVPQGWKRVASCKSTISNTISEVGETMQSGKEIPDKN